MKKLYSHLFIRTKVEYGICISFQLSKTIQGSNIVFHAIAFARSREGCLKYWDLL